MFTWSDGCFGGSSSPQMMGAGLSPAFTEGLSDGRCFYCSSLTHSA